MEKAIKAILSIAIGFVVVYYGKELIVNGRRSLGL